MGETLTSPSPRLVPLTSFLPPPSPPPPSSTSSSHLIHLLFRDSPSPCDFTLHSWPEPLQSISASKFLCRADEKCDSTGLLRQEPSNLLTTRTELKLLTPSTQQKTHGEPRARSTSQHVDQNAHPKSECLQNLGSHPQHPQGRSSSGQKQWQ